MFEELDECGMPTYGARMETAATTVAVSGFETEEDALVALEAHMAKIEFRGKSFFISGPMTGIEFNNAPEFARVHAFLKKQGSNSIYDPAYHWLEEKGHEKTHEYYMRVCLAALISGTWDYVVMLDGWEHSAGARLEHDVAVGCGVDVIGVEDLSIPAAVAPVVPF